MKHTKSILLTGALLLAASSLSFAQDAAPAAPPTPPPAQGTDKPAPRPEGRRHGPPAPLFALFDTNKDGVIDATEIANAPAVLKALDKNGDGKLTPDEVRPPRPEGRRDGRPNGGPDRRGPGGPDGPGRGDLPPPPPAGQGPDNAADAGTPPAAPAQ